jgi:hypothetical protein
LRQSFAEEKGSVAHRRTPVLLHSLPKKKRKEKMSHWEKVESSVTDLDVLQSACEELGATVLRDAKARGWSTSGVNDQMVPMVIRIPNSRFDLAVKKSACGCYYEIEGDWYDGSLEKHFGKEGHRVGKILEMYSVHKAEGLCKKKRKKFKRVVHDTHIDVEVFA